MNTECNEDSINHIFISISFYFHDTHSVLIISWVVCEQGELSILSSFDLYFLRFILLNTTKLLLTSNLNLTIVAETNFIIIVFL